MTKKVKEGDKVKLHYTGRFKDGKVFDSSENQEPLQFEVGLGEVIKGVDEAVIDMEPGEKKDISVSPNDAYGSYDEKLLIDVPKDKIPEGMNPKKGSMLRLMDNKGKAVPVTVTEVKKDSIQVDANHPLAGKELNFKIELVDIV